jgi:hypothetical protein
MLVYNWGITRCPFYVRAMQSNCKITIWKRLFSCRCSLVYNKDVRMHTKRMERTVALNSPIWIVHLSEVYAFTAASQVSALTKWFELWNNPVPAQARNTYKKKLKGMTDIQQKRYTIWKTPGCFELLIFRERKKNGSNIWNSSKYLVILEPNLFLHSHLKREALKPASSHQRQILATKDYKRDFQCFEMRTERRTLTKYWFLRILVEDISQKR